MMRMYVSIGLAGLMMACGAKTEPTEKQVLPQKVEESATKTVVPTQQVKAEPITRKLAVQGMTCGGCAASVRQALLSVEGVKDATVDFATGEASIECDESVSADTLIQHVENYEVGGVKQSYKAQEVTGKAPEPTTGASSSSVEHKLAIRGMCCNGCAANVQNALMAVDGVEQADVSYANGQAIVRTNESVAASTLIDTLQTRGKVRGNRKYKVRELTQ